MYVYFYDTYYIVYKKRVKLKHFEIMGRRNITPSHYSKLREAVIHFFSTVLEFDVPRQLRPQP